MNIKIIISKSLRLKSDDIISNEISMESTPAWDSMAHMELITSIERAYEIILTPDEILSMTSIVGIYEVLKKHGIIFSES